MLLWGTVKPLRVSLVEPVAYLGDSYEKALKFIRTTKTTTGLKVTAYLDTAYYPTGVKVSQQELAELSIHPKRILPKWNYTILPRM
jgi:hypothetical protein